jgi:hypothetical protein
MTMPSSLVEYVDHTPTFHSIKTRGQFIACRNACSREDAEEFLGTQDTHRH